MLIQLIINGILAGGAMALLGVSFGIIFNITRTWHIAHGGTFLIAGYTFYQTVAVWHLNIIVATVLSVIVAAIMGILIQHLIYRPMYRSGATGNTVMVGSLGLIIAVQALCMLIWSSTPRLVRVSEGFLVESFEIGGSWVTGLNIATVAISLLLWLLMELFLKRSKMGKSIRAMSADPEMAELVGVNRDWVSVVCYAIGSILMAVAAILTMLDVSIQPARGFTAFFLGVICVIVGGIGSIRGAVLAAFIIGLAENLAIWKLPSEYKESIAFLILLVFILFCPTGLLGSRGKQLR